MKPRSLFALVLLFAPDAAPTTADDPEPRLPATASRSIAALEAARVSRGEWRLSPFVVRRTDDGRRRVRAALLYRGAVVARLRVDPRTGRFLGARERAEAPAEALDLIRLRAQAERALMDVAVAGWAWPAEDGRAWRFPLVYDGRVVGQITVDGRDDRVHAVDEND